MLKLNLPINVYYFLTGIDGPKFPKDGIFQTEFILMQRVKNNSVPVHHMATGETWYPTEQWQYVEWNRIDCTLKVTATYSLCSHTQHS
jgi:hypothetical protein